MCSTSKWQFDQTDRQGEVDIAIYLIQINVILVYDR